MPNVFSHWNFRNYIFEVVLEFYLLPLQPILGMYPGVGYQGTSSLILGPGINAFWSVAVK